VRNRVEAVIFAFDHGLAGGLAGGGG
jgi:hypothetical protein